MSVLQLTIINCGEYDGFRYYYATETKLAEVGTISILSWIVTAVGSMALAYAFLLNAVCLAVVAEEWGYAEYAFGKSRNFMANYTYGISC